MSSVRAVSKVLETIRESVSDKMGKGWFLQFFEQVRKLEKTSKKTDRAVELVLLYLLPMDPRVTSSGKQLSTILP